VVEGFFGESYKGVFGRTEQFLNALLPLLDEQPCDVDGGQVFAKGWLTIEAEPVPTLLAALSPQMLELAGRLTAGTSVASCRPKTIATHVVPRIVDAAERAGRPAPRIVALVAVCVTDDDEGLLAHGRQQTQMYDTFSSYRAALDREG
jgi:5,10-methylenetetrahydromethanopterin reductase